MLNIMRRYGSTWAVKTILALIIFSFILFFGYSRMSHDAAQGRTYAAAVGDEYIPRRKLLRSQDAAVENLRKNLGSSVPKNMEDFLRQNVLNEMIGRELTSQYAARLGLKVNDEELAQSIRENKSLFPEGSVDLAAYETKFLPSYLRNYGEDFETAVRRDLLIEKTQLLLADAFSPWHDELTRYDGEKVKSAPKKTAAKPSKKTAESQSAESQPAFPQWSALDLFSPWQEGFQKTVVVKVYP